MEESRSLEGSVGFVGRRGVELLGQTRERLNRASRQRVRMDHAGESVRSVAEQQSPRKVELPVSDPAQVGVAEPSGESATVEDVEVETVLLPRPLLEIVPDRRGHVVNNENVDLVDLTALHHFADVFFDLGWY